jgi:CHAT domain-containing protein/tetratricopeptide (TPR) repeat protein
METPAYPRRSPAIPVKVRARQLWDRRVRVLRHASRGCIPGAVLILSCGVLALAPGLASPPSLQEQATQAIDEAQRLSRAGRYREAIPLMEDALRSHEMALGSAHSQVAASLNSLADLYRLQGQYGRAESFYQRALAVREQALGPTHPQVATTLDNLAELYRDQGQYGRAEPLYQRALVIREQALGPTHRRVAASLNGLAALYRLQGQYGRAEPLHQRALAIREQALSPTHPYVAASLNSLADLYRLQGQYGRAEPLYQRAMTVWEQALGPTHPQVALILGNLATLLGQQQETARALPLFERARQIYLTVNHTNADLEEEAHRGLLRQQTQTLRAYAALLATMARELGSGATPPSAALAAFVVAEQARVGAVQRALARASARAAVTEPGTVMLARQVQDLQYRQRAVWKQLSDAYRAPVAAWDAPHMASLQQTMQQVDRELTEAAGRLHQAFPRYAELVAPAPIDIPAVQALLRSDEALVSLFTLPDRVLVWLVRPGEPPVYRDVMIAQQALQTMVARVRRSLEQGPSRPFDVTQAHALATLLLAPLREQLAGVTHLLLVPDDELLPLPFGVLVTEATGEPYQRLAGLVTQPRRPTTRDLATYARIAWLAKDYALTTLPSATALRALRQLPRLPGTPREPLLGFGDPVLQGDGGRRGGAPMPPARGSQVSLEALRRLPRLPETHTELLAVATALGADPRQALYLGDRATKPAVQALNAAGRLGQAQVLAFATHALLVGEFTELTQPALVLTPPVTPSDQDDGLLALEDILGLRLSQTSWVVLSACHTAADDGSGEGLSGLARAFFFAGAASLLVSHWSVDDAATRVLMSEVFHRQARTPALIRAEALRQGMLAVMTGAQGKAAYFAHPYAWAPFMLVGEGGRGRS